MVSVDVSDSASRSGRAFRLKEALREIFATANTKTVAKVQMQAWFRWARRSRLAPFKKLALTLKSHWDGILNGFGSALSNGSVEAIKGMSDSADGRQVMATFGDQATSNKSGAKTAVDGHYADATVSGGGEFIFDVVGIVSDPFADFA
jgi:hypothetical protein